MLKERSKNFGKDFMMREFSHQANPKYLFELIRKSLKVPLIDDQIAAQLTSLNLKVFKIRVLKVKVKQNAVYLD